MSFRDSAALELDAREILRYLNDLGIRNISGEALRDFITDLKKLIKYDLQHKSQDDERDVQGPERLHSASTFCSRIRSKHRDQPIGSCQKECTKRREYVGVRNVTSAPALGRQRDKVEAPRRRSCSCTRVESKEKKVDQPKRKVLASSSNLIKVQQTQPQKKKADPVSLYHYYLTMWDKYKTNVPGQNSWADLRWSIRQKLAGEVQRAAIKKTAAPTAKALEKRRQGWVD